MQIKIRPIKKHFSKLWLSEYRYNICRGGAGSGKSYSLAQIVLLELLTRDRCRWLVLRKVGKDILRSVYQLFLDICIENDMLDVFHFNKTDKIITCNKNGNQIFMSGLDDPERIKSITGITDIWLEEATEFNKDDWNQLTLRLRGEGEKRRFFLTFNPVSSKSWLKEIFYDRDTYKDDIQFIHSNYKDNPFLDDAYKKELEGKAETDPEWYKIYVLNEWGEIGEFRILLNVVIHDFQINETVQHFNGGDFGYNDPSTLTDCYIYDQELYICHEFYKNELDPESLKAEVRKIKWIQGKKNVVCDSSRPDLIAMYNSAGRTFISYPARKNVLSARNKGYKTSMAFYLQQFKKIHVHKTNCPNAAEEFISWSWQTDKEKRPIDIPEDGYDHTIDAIIYSLEERARRYYATNRK